MKELTTKENDLIKLAVIEGLVETQNKLWIDFRVRPSKLTENQQHRISLLEDLLYTFFQEVVENHGSLQSEYDQL